MERREVLKSLIVAPFFIRQYLGELIKQLIFNDSQYLTLPFAENDLFKPGSRRGEYDITEGWLYSAFERSVHGFSLHRSLDIAVPYGTPVYAPCEGYAISTFSDRWLRDLKGRIKTYQGREMRFGLGYHVVIHNQRVNRDIVLAHLSNIAPEIPFSLPHQSGQDWLPTSYELLYKESQRSSLIKAVKRGDLIGWVGYSGIGWGYNNDYLKGAKRPVILDLEKYQTWDETHLHMEECRINPKTSKRESQRDIYGLYADYKEYRTPSRVGKIGKDRLIICDRAGFPVFAR